MTTKVALHSAEWRALVLRLQKIREAQDKTYWILRRLPPVERCTAKQRELGRKVAEFSRKLDNDEREIRAQLPFNPEGL